MPNQLNVPVILAAVKQAGDLFLQEFKQHPIPHDKAGFMAMLDDIEVRCLAALQAGLAAEFPETPWQGDEFDYDEQRQPLALPEYWLCDTMDGAIQYLQHLPGWTINLVLVRAGQPYFAAIYDPLGQELFWAQAGAGAFLNNAPIKPSAKRDLEMALSVFEYSNHTKTVPGLPQKIGNSLADLVKHCGAVRNYGPHGLQLALLGAGRIDLFLQEGLDTYNWLPGILIAREAGAEILTTDGRPWQWGEESLLAAAPGLAEMFLQAKA